MLKNFEQALGTSKPFTSVSVLIDRLSSDVYKEDDFEGIPELVEAINIQGTGPAEASRALRKKLKYGSVHGQKRALTMLGACVENSGPRFQTTFADERLVNQIKLMSQDPLVDASVRRKLMRMLLNWNRQFAREPTMRTVSGLYTACGGGRKSDAQLKSEAAEAYRKQREREERERQLRVDRKAAERLQKEEDKRREKERKKTGGAARRQPFNFEKEKPQVQLSLATSQQAATQLVNALQHVNREKDSVTSDQRVQTYLAKVKQERKKIVRYIQLVQDEEFLGSLISANDQVILALELYDKLAKPAADSDDEQTLDSLRGMSREQRERAKAEAEEAEIEIVQRRLAEARLDYPEGELEKLQDRQRRGIERHNSFMSRRSQSIRSGHEGAAGASAASTSGGASDNIRDLMDLNFDDDGQARVGPSRADLSDYSDYESEEEEVAGAGAERWRNLREDDESEVWSTHRPEIGVEHVAGAEDGEDDPFGDAHQAPSASTDDLNGRDRGARMEFAAV